MGIRNLLQDFVLRNIHSHRPPAALASSLKNYLLFSRPVDDHYLEASGSVLGRTLLITYQALGDNQLTVQTVQWLQRVVDAPRKPVRASALKHLGTD